MTVMKPDEVMSPSGLLKCGVLVRLKVAAEALAIEAVGRPQEPPDLLLIGGPTQRHGMSPALRGRLEQDASGVHLPVLQPDGQRRCECQAWSGPAHFTVR